MYNKLLSIAIPTWNRSDFLSRALDNLLPQVQKFGGMIEIIISDNSSSDDTWKIIEYNKIKYADIDFVLFKQIENTGYYGNFKKCRELSNGEYLWILSDNDYVRNGVVHKLIEILLSNASISFIVLHDRSVDNNNSPAILSSSELLSINDALLYVRSKITLISTIIYRNNKEEDELLFDQYSSNSFLHLILLAQSFSVNGKCLILYGESLYSDNLAKASFDPFMSWTKDIMEALLYILSSGYVKALTINKFVNGYLKNTLSWHVYNCKLKEPTQIYRTNYRSVYKKYYRYRNYWLYIFPIRVIPFKIIKIYKLRVRFITYLKKYFGFKR